MNWIKLFLINILILLTGSTIAQNSWKNRLYIEGNYHYGFLMPHTDYISYFVQEHIQGFQINVGLLADGTKSWHTSYNFPRLGVGYYHSGLANRKIYGNVDAVFGYVDRYYRPWNKRFNIGNRLCFGVASISKHFDLENNSLNLAIGSRYNAYVNYSLETIFKLLPKTELKFGGGITHVSNGNFNQPNKGLNFITVYTGLTYSLNNPESLIIHSNTYTLDTSKHQFIVSAVYGNKQISRRMDYRYSVTGLSGEYSHNIIGNSWAGAAITIYHDPSLIKELELGDSIKTNFSDNIRISLNVIYELKMGRVSYLFEPGVYLKNPYKVVGSVSNRIALRYQINDHWLAGLAIKAHWFAIADFFEWGVGYKWNR